MTTYVLRDGALVPKSGTQRQVLARSDKFPLPMLSRMEPYASPIDGREITSWGARDRDMKANNAVDPRDLKVNRHVGPKPKQQLDLFPDASD